MAITGNKVRQIPVTLDGSLWGITTFFNSSGYVSKYRNYRFFRNRSRRQGLNLLCVELAFDADPFVLQKGRDAEIVIQIRGTRRNNLLWQKERLLNIGLMHVPESCDKVCWIDCDLVFKNENWVSETSELLEKYVVLQPFDSVVRLPRGMPDLSKTKLKRLGPSQVKPGIVSQRLNGELIPGEVGFAWAARKSLLKRTLLYDAIPTGGQDVIMASAFLNDASVREWLRLFSTEAMKADQDRYVAEMSREVQGSYHFTTGTILHLWHGSVEERLYIMRWRLLRSFCFAPCRDLRLDGNSIWEWASDKPRFHQAVQEYFEWRNEDGNGTGDSSLFQKLMGAQKKLEKMERHANSIRRSPSYTFLRRLAKWALAKGIRASVE